MLSLDQERREKCQTHGNQHHQVHEGGGKVITARTRNNLLQKAQSWDIKVDLGERLQLPKVIQTTLRLDVAPWSKEAIKIMLIELTVLWEEAFDRRSAKYLDLLHDCRGKEWQA